MAYSTHLSLQLLLCLILLAVVYFSRAAAQVDDAELSLRIASTEELEWPSEMSLLDGEFEESGDADAARRSLFWRRIMRYYISYGALSANRIPCPPRSGRSYYTHNCYKARGPAHPYTRGCSAITRCSR